MPVAWRLWRLPQSAAVGIDGDDVEQPNLTRILTIIPIEWNWRHTPGSYGDERGGTFTYGWV